MDWVLVQIFSFFLFFFFFCLSFVLFLFDLFLGFPGDLRKIDEKNFDDE